MAAEMIEVEAQFNKKFKFKNIKSIKLSSGNVFKHSAWQVDELKKLKSSLNSTKSLLNDKDIQIWHCHTALVNRAGLVLNRVKKEIYPELLTQAWLKFYECINQFNLVVTSKNSSFSSLHLCEAPGAFITALNHYLTSHYVDVEFNWLGATLNPYFEGNTYQSMIDDDRFIFPTLTCWYFGADNTGNIMDSRNAGDLIEKARKLKIDLVTGDGSINCVDEPSEQENRVSHLHWCETIVALKILEAGGHLVLKMFTFFEHSAVCLLYFLRICFEDLNVFKPCTSKEGNSEVYVIANNYQKTEENLLILDTLQDFIFNRNGDINMWAAFSREDIATSFIQDVIKCATVFKEWQESAILRNLTLYNLSVDLEALRDLKEAVATRYMELYRLRRISSKRQLVGTRNLQVTRWKSDLGLQNRPTFHSWPRDPLKRLEFMRSELQEFDRNLRDNTVGRWNVEHIDWTEWIHHVEGRAYQRVTNSKFCHPHILRILLEMKSFDETSTAQFLRFDQQSALLNGFLSEAHTLSPGSNWFFHGRPLLSRFAVSTIWIIAQLFKTIEFDSGNESAILFIGYRPNDAIIEFMKNLDEKLLSFVDITELCRGVFYKLIFIFNTKVLLHCSLNMITAVPFENL